MLVNYIPGQPDVLTWKSLAEAVLPDGNRLALDLAQNDAVGTEVFDGLYVRRMTALRHDADMLRPDTDQPVAPRDQIHRGGTDEPRRECGGRPIVQLLRRTVLLDAPVAHQHDAIGHGHGFGLVVRHIDHGDTEALLQRPDFSPHLVTQLGVEIRQRFIHQADARLRNNGAPERHALALPAGQLRRLALEQLFETDDLRHALKPLVALGAGYPAHAQAEDDILGHAQMRKQGVGLEDHRDLALGRRQMGDVGTADGNRTTVELFEACDQTKRCGFAAAGWTKQHQQRAFLCRETDVVDGPHRAPILGNVIQRNRRHDLPGPAWQRRAIGTFAAVSKHPCPLLP
jgi:hypothetical protein